MTTIDDLVKEQKTTNLLLKEILADGMILLIMGIIIVAMIVGVLLLAKHG
jgi:hypothetical protein